ncbi:MAG: hypothetical protein CMJ83_04570 [Planctomycetes bacterium]|nr:hypothetical protein [Planctomycetota bacterium]
MSKRFHLLNLWGIPLRCNGTLFFALFLLGLFLFISSHDVMAAVRTMSAALLTIVCVVAHEYGHALAARRMGVPVYDVYLHAFFGMTRMEPPRTSREEFMIGLAGPGTNLVLAAILAPLAWEWGRWDGWLPTGPLSIALVANLALGTLNLVPAFPMDGGRLLRALLNLRMSDLSATRIAVGIGRFLAALMVLSPLALGFIRISLILPVIGILVFLLGEAEWRRVCLRAEERRVAAWLQNMQRGEVGPGSSPLRERDDTAEPEPDPELEPGSEPPAQAPSN